MTIKELKASLEEMDENLEIMVSSMKYYDNFPIKQSGVDDYFDEKNKKWSKKFFIVID